MTINNNLGKNIDEKCNFSILTKFQCFNKTNPPTFQCLQDWLQKIILQSAKYFYLFSLSKEKRWLALMLRVFTRSNQIVLSLKVTCIEVTGSMIITGSQDCTIRLWVDFLMGVIIICADHWFSYGRDYNMNIDNCLGMSTSTYNW